MDSETEICWSCQMHIGVQWHIAKCSITKERCEVPCLEFNCHNKCERNAIVAYCFDLALREPLNGNINEITT